MFPVVPLSEWPSHIWISFICLPSASIVDAQEWRRACESSLKANTPLSKKWESKASRRWIFPLLFCIFSELKVFCQFLAYIINNKDIDYVYLCFKLTFYLLLQEASYQIQQNILHFFNLLFFLQTQLRILLQYMSAKKKNYCWKSCCILSNNLKFFCIY